MENLERALTNNSLAVPAISLGLGIFTCDSLELESLWGIALLVSSVLIYLMTTYISANPIIAYRYRMLHYIWLAVAFIGVGILFSSNAIPDTPTNLTNFKIKILKGEVTNIQENTSGDILLVSVNKIQTESNSQYPINNLQVQLHLKNVDSKVSVGDIILFSGKLTRISDNPNSFKSGYARLMASKGILYRCDIIGNQIKIYNHKKSFRSLSNSIRNTIEKYIENTRIAKRTQNFLITILLGDKDYLDPDLRSTFADAGVAHILALSGMHTGIIGGIILFLLFPLNFAGKYKLRLILAALLLWLYAFISGMSPSTVRACIMISFTAIAITLERKRYIFNSLFAAAFIILLVSPISLYDIGFQLSFLCVASLVAFTSHINRVDHHRYPKLYRFASVLTATIAASFGSWIFCAFYFKAFPLAFLPANLIILPLLPFYIVFSLIYLLLAICGLNINGFAHMLDFGYNALVKLADWLGSGNVLEVDVSFEMVVIWCVALMLLSCYLNIIKWKPILYTSLVAISFVFCLIPANASAIHDGSFIICDTYHHISIVVKQFRNERQYNVRRGCNTILKIKDKAILVIDSNNLHIPTDRPYDYIILGSGYKGNIPELIRFTSNSRIIIHPSIRRKRENKMLKDAEIFGVECHSLRLHKSIRNII